MIAVLTLSSFKMQNWYPAAGTGTDTVQVPVQTAIPDGAARVMEALGVGTGTGATPTVVPVPPFAAGRVPLTSAVSETAADVTVCVLPAK